MRSDVVPRVLVVDDDPAIRLFAELVLSEGGYEVVLAGDGKAALDLTANQTRPFDLFVIDLMMPGMTGDQLAFALRRLEPDIKVLFFTGFGDELFKEKRRLAAYEAYVDKPVTVKGLQEAVSLLLYGHTSGPQLKPR